MHRFVWSFAVFLLILSMIPPGLFLFSRKRPGVEAFISMLHNYKWHILVIVAIFALKSFADIVNDPIRDGLHVDFTPVIYSIEGDAALYIQNVLLNNGLTIFLAGVYTFGFLFAFNFSFVMYAYEDDRRTAGRMVFVNLLLTLMSLAFFLFIPVFVTSWPAMNHSLDPGAPATSGIPGMRPLLYNLKPWLTDFFYAHDTFDNCFPSLHIAMPLSMAIIVYGARTASGMQGTEAGEERGWRESGWSHTAYLGFLVCLTCLVALSILYLGIHWFIDIPAGMALIPPALWLAERYDEKFFSRLNRWLDGTWQRLKAAVTPVICWNDGDFVANIGK